MFECDNTVLIELASKHAQFCVGLKSIIDGGCSFDSLSGLLEELCDQSESIAGHVSL